MSSRWGFLTLVFLLGFQNAKAITSRERLQSEIEQSAILYFLENANPKTGLVLDKASNFDPSPNVENRTASMAATGFGIAVLANAADRKLIDRHVAYKNIFKTLAFSREHVARRKGWFVHFIDWETGANKWTSEFSTIDTALFMAGALYASSIFPGTEIDELTRLLYSEMDFLDVMTDGATKPAKRSLSMAVSETGRYTDAQWSMYAEQRILLILGLGHPTHPLPADAWVAWSRKQIDGLMGLNEALFVHQYSELFLDFRDFHDSFPSLYRNSVNVSKFHRNLTLSEPHSETLRSGFWGFSAGLTPSGYEVFTAISHKNIVCLACSVASVMYLPVELFTDIKNWRNGPYAKRIWGRYGFVDSLDIDQKWFAQETLGITVGPEYLALANLRDETSIWHRMMSRPEIRRGMQRASDASQSLFLTQENFQ